MSDVTNSWQGFQCIVKVGTQFPFGERSSLYLEKEISSYNCLTGKQQTPQADIQIMDVCVSDENNEGLPERRARIGGNRL